MDVCLRVAEFIQRENLLQTGQRLVAGVSGGADSLCLLVCLHDLGYPIVIAHLDHQLRPESKSEADFVRDLAGRYDLPVVIAQEDVRTKAGPGGSLEEAARLARYRFLTQVARERGVGVIATGHTADDQAETVLMHFLRGAGLSGMRGMLPATSMEKWIGIPDAAGITLVRPLLEITSEETRAHCIAKGLQPILDPSNLDTAFHRNRIRHHLLPILETYNPGIRRVLGRTARVMAGEAEWLETIVGERWTSIVRASGDRVVTIRVESFLDSPIALQRALLRGLIAHLCPTSRDIGFETIERARSFVGDQRRGRRQTLVGGLEMLHFIDEVVVRERNAPIEYPQFPQLISSRPRRLVVPGDIRLAKGWRLEAVFEELTADQRRLYMTDSSRSIAALDKSTVDTPLMLRSVRAGDRIRPLGMKGTIKIADLFVNRHVPRPARAHWPLVVDGDRIVWVVGLHMSEEVRITEKTQQAIVLRLVSPKDERP